MFHGKVEGSPRHGASPTHARIYSAHDYRPPVCRASHGSPPSFRPSLLIRHPVSVTKRVYPLQFSQKLSQEITYAQKKTYSSISFAAELISPDLK